MRDGSSALGLARPAHFRVFPGVLGNNRTLDGVRADVGTGVGNRVSGLARVVCNPFYVLGLTPAARAAQVTLRFRALRSDLRRGRSLTFTTPLGPQPLDLELLGLAYVELRDADMRLEHELRFVPVRGRKPSLSVVRTEAS